MFGRRKSCGRRGPEADSRYGADEYAEYEADYDEYDTGGYHRQDYDTGECAEEYDDTGYAEGDYGDPDEPLYDYDDIDIDEADVYDPDTEPQRRGPYDYDDVADVLEKIVDQRLDLGSVIIPVPPGGQLQVEMTPQGTPQAVHLATEHGRITVAAYAAPKSGGQWRTVAADLAESLRKEGARVSVEKGPWGRELFANTADADLRFIGVDGPRWMLRLVAAGPAGAVDADSPLVVAARAVLNETVVRRGTEALPVREPLPVVLPQELADQLAAAHQQQILAAQQAAAAQAAVQQAAAARTASPGSVLTPPQPRQPRRGAEGSAMQQLRRS